MFLILLLARPAIIPVAMCLQKYALSFGRRAISKGVTLSLLISYGLAIIFILVAALGTFGLLANPVSVFDKVAASIVVCGTILSLESVARLLRVLHATKTVSSRMLLESLQPNNVTAFVISHHLGNAFFYSAVSCLPTTAIVLLCIWAECWYIIITLTDPFIVLSILSFPLYDAVCGTRMLILKKSIWDDLGESLALFFCVPACSVPILLLQNTSLISSFGALFFAHIFGFKLFGNAQVLNPYSIMTCTIVYFANNILHANMAAEAPAQIGIYLNAPPAANLEKIPESEFAGATKGLYALLC